MVGHFTLSVRRMPSRPFTQSKWLLYYSFEPQLKPYGILNFQPEPKTLKIWAVPLHIGLGTERVKGDKKPPQAAEDQRLWSNSVGGRRMWGCGGEKTDRGPHRKRCAVTARGQGWPGVAETCEAREKNRNWVLRVIRLTPGELPFPDPRWVMAHAGSVSVLHEGPRLRTMTDESTPGFLLHR